MVCRFTGKGRVDQSRLDNDDDDHDDGDDTKTNDNENVNPLDPITPTTDQYEKVYPKLKGFKIGHLNIASLVKHKNELLVFLAKLPFDVICINETRLDDSIDNSEVKIPGYDLIRKDGNRNGGGVAIYLRNVIPYTNRADLISS